MKISHWLFIDLFNYNEQHTERLESPQRNHKCYLRFQRSPDWFQHNDLSSLPNNLGRNDTRWKQHCIRKHCKGMEVPNFEIGKTAAEMWCPLAAHQGAQEGCLGLKLSQSDIKIVAHPLPPLVLESVYLDLPVFHLNISIVFID